jgi:glycosyltransferase involved in cell wall biosynthesis
MMGHTAERASRLQAGEPPVVLAVGRLAPEKDFACLLRAFALLRKRRRARLLILGEGETRQELDRLAAELKVMEDVSMPGFASNPYAYMSRAYLYGLTSLLVLAVIIRRSNPVSFLSLYGAGTILYGMSLFFGYTTFITAFKPTVQIYYAELDGRIYARYFAAQAVFFAASLFPDRPYVVQKKPDSLIFPAVQFALLLYIFLFLVMMGVDKLFLAKSLSQ